MTMMMMTTAEMRMQMGMGMGMRTETGIAAAVEARAAPFLREALQEGLHDVRAADAVGSPHADEGLAIVLVGVVDPVGEAFGAGRGGLGGRRYGGVSWGWAGLLGLGVSPRGVVPRVRPPGRR